MKSLLILSSMFLLLAITACDDDDDDCDGCPPFSITTENAPGVTRGVMNTTSDLIDLSELSRDTVEDITKAAEEDAQSRATSVSATAKGISLSIPFDCDSGSADVSWGDNDENTASSAGDTFGLKFNNCVLQDDGATLNGTMSLSVSAVVDLQPTSEIGLAIAINFQNLEVSRGTKVQVLQGDVAISPSAVVENDNSLVVVSISGNSLTLSEPNNNETSTLTSYSVQHTVDPKIDPQPYRDQLSGTLATTELSSGSVNFRTDPQQPFTGTGDNPPEAGLMTLEATNVTVSDISGLNATLTVQAIGDGKVRLDLNAMTEANWDQIL